jgi:hypothetical protein
MSRCLGPLKLGRTSSLTNLDRRLSYNANEATEKESTCLVYDYTCADFRTLLNPYVPLKAEDTLSRADAAPSPAPA